MVTQLSTISYCDIHSRVRNLQRNYSAYISVGRNKKQAKRRVAELAAQSLYNITFDDPTPMTDRHHDQHLTICNDPAREE